MHNKKHINLALIALLGLSSVMQTTLPAISVSSFIGWTKDAVKKTYAKINNLSMPTKENVLVIIDWLGVVNVLLWMPIYIQYFSFPTRTLILGRGL